MRHFEDLQRGLSVIEMMIAIAISTTVIGGTMQMWAKYEKSANSQRALQANKGEDGEVSLMIRKVWDYRRRDNIPGIPSTGFYLQNLDGTPCKLNCPQLKAWVKRTLSGASVTDEVTVRNECISLTNSPVATKMKTLNFKSAMNASCGSCSQGLAPSFTVTGLILGTSKKTLSAENQRYPGNLRALSKVRIDSALGSQICFSQNAVTDPLSVDLRFMFLQNDGLKIKNFQSTKVFGLDNFAGIKLEQAP